MADPAGQQMTAWQRRTVGFFLVLAAVLLLYATFEVWATELTTEERTAEPIVFGLFPAPSSEDSRILVLVMLSGAVGSYVHAASSFASYAGNRRLHASWMWWYILRGFIGAALALIMYLVIRGGLLVTADGEDPPFNLYGIAGLSALVGMFSKQATLKLNELFNNLFRVDQSPALADRLDDGDGRGRP